MALGDVSVRDLSVILENLSFSSLVEPFQKNGVSGRAISRIESYQDVMDIDESKIKKVVARTFYEDHVVPWQKTGGIPRDLLQPALASTFSGKVVVVNSTTTTAYTTTATTTTTTTTTTTATTTTTTYYHFYYYHHY